MNTLIVILGPTGVGKTDVCLRVAEHFCIPIINADSRQLYREIPIGTAAPTLSQQARVRHFFVGTHSIDDYYSASMYEQDVLQLLEKLWEDKRIALLSGGSMMYVDAVCNGIDDIPTVDDEIRVWMKERFAREGLDALCEELRQMDPDYYEIVDRKNYRRVIHALEIIHQSGKTYTSFRTQQTKERPFRILKIGLNRPREELYDRINRRVDQMVADGLVEEARRMYPHRENNALNTVGYKELFLAFDGKWTLDEAIERIKGNTRRYCRKQLTWYKRDTTIHWFSPDQVEDITHLIHDNCPQAT
jgi:tRNA dimethylallyltransferase